MPLCAAAGGAVHVACATVLRWPCLSALSTTQSSDCSLLCPTGRPRFIFPVFKDHGAFFMLVGEWQDRSCIFTYLEQYKRDLNAAEPCVFRLE